jgi:hypothetical protein
VKKGTPKISYTGEGTNMDQNTQETPIPRWLQNAIERYDNGRYCHTTIAGTDACKNRVPIDCSHLGKHIDDEAGFDIPYMTTGEKHLPKAAEKYHVTEAQRDGMYVPGLNVRPGDTILFDGHEGKVVTYDPSDGSGTFFGSQNHTGPAVTRFGPGAWGKFQKPDKFLRPNDSGDPKGILRGTDFVSPYYQVR